MGMPAARLTDMHVCPMVTGIIPHVGGPIAGPGCPTVLIGMLPAARVTDMLVCVGPPDIIAKGSSGVLIGGMPAARLGDMCAHGGVIILGCPTVLIGETGGGGGGGGAGAGAAGAGAGGASGATHPGTTSAPSKPSSPAKGTPKPSHTTARPVRALRPTKVRPANPHVGSAGPKVTHAISLIRRLKFGAPTKSIVSLPNGMAGTTPRTLGNSDAGALLTDEIFGAKTGLGIDLGTRAVKEVVKLLAANRAFAHGLTKETSLSHGAEVVAEKGIENAGELLGFGMGFVEAAAAVGEVLGTSDYRAKVQAASRAFRGMAVGAVSVLAAVGVGLVVTAFAVPAVPAILVGMAVGIGVGFVVKWVWKKWLDTRVQNWLR